MSYIDDEENSEHFISSSLQNEQNQNESKQDKQNKKSLSLFEKNEQFLKSQMEKRKQKNEEKQNKLKSNTTTQDNLIDGWIQTYGQDHVQVISGTQNLKKLENEYIINQKNWMNKKSNT